MFMALVLLSIVARAADPAGPPEATWHVSGSRTRLVEKTDPATHERQWSVFLDRPVLVDLTSEASVEACERAFHAGASVCTVHYDECVAISYAATARRKRAIEYAVLPSACDARTDHAVPTGRGGAEWVARSLPSGEEVARIPVETTTSRSSR